MSPKKKIFAYTTAAVCIVFLLGGGIFGVLSHGNGDVMGPYWIFGICAVTFTGAMLLLGLDD